MDKRIISQLAGAEQIVEENAVLRKYAANRSAEKGQMTALIDRYHPRSLKLKVANITTETPSTKTLRFTSDTGYLPPFQAGQYINVFTEINGVRTSRPYSISSSPTQTGYYDITVRRVEEGFVSGHLLEGIKTGDQLESTAPSGHFHHNPLFHGEDLVFLAGGSGITPFMSMIRENVDRGLTRKIHLIYGCRTEEDIIFSHELQRISAENPNISVSLVISEPKPEYTGLNGFISAGLISDLVGDVSDKMFYLCGPEVMYDFVLAELKELNIPDRKIRVEVFGPPSNVSSQPGWPDQVSPNEVFQVEFNGHHTLEAKAGEPLMNSLERSGLTIPASCRSGECSLCRTKLQSGRVYQPRGTKMRKSDQKYGYIHPCMAYPLENLVLKT